MIEHCFNYRIIHAGILSEQYGRSSKSRSRQLERAADTRNRLRQQVAREERVRINGMSAANELEWASEPVGTLSLGERKIIFPYKALTQGCHQGIAWCGC